MPSWFCVIVKHVREEGCEGEEEGGREVYIVGIVLEEMRKRRRKKKKKDAQTRRREDETRQNISFRPDQTSLCLSLSVSLAGAGCLAEEREGKRRRNLDQAYSIIQSRGEKEKVAASRGEDKIRQEKTACSEAMRDKKKKMMMMMISCQ